MEAWAALLVGIVLGSIGTAFGMWIRDITIDAERWGKSLELEDKVEWAIDYDAQWRGLENVRPRTTPLYDYDKEKKA